MRKLLILLSLAPIAIVTGCPKDSPSPTPNPPGPTPDPVPSITIGKTNADIFVDGSLDNYDWVTKFQITTNTGLPINVEVISNNIDTGFEWKTNKEVTIKVTSGAVIKTQAVSFTFVDNNYSNDDIYRNLEKAVFKIKVPTGETTSSEATAHVIDHDKTTGEMIFATNHHVVMNGSSNTALIRHKDEGKTYVNDSDLLGSICAQVIAYDPNGRNSDIDLAFLKAVGTTTSETNCDGYTPKTNFNDEMKKVRMFSIPKETFANYNNSTVAKYRSTLLNYFAIGFPSVTYKKDSFKWSVMSEQQQMINNSVNTYKFDAFYFSTYFGPGSSGMPIIDQNMVLVGINSQGFSGTTQQAGVMTTDIWRFANRHYCPNVTENYNGRLC